MKDMIACCGLDCSVCDLRLAESDPVQAKYISDWINENTSSTCSPEDIHCTWCRGDKAGHWSADCWILKCCYEDKGLNYCSECSLFPCKKLIEWSKQSDKYTQAIKNLKTRLKGNNI